jgi:hypothetical protein
MIADEDYTLYLSESTPVGTLSYSGVIVTLAPNGTGYKVSGYNRNNPYFTIYPGVLTAQTAQIGVGNDIFTYPTVFGNSPVTVPYNTTLSTAQDVVDFLAGYGQYLSVNGLSFNTEDKQSKITWQDAALQFIKWSLVSWGSNLSLVLNPCSSIIEYTAASGTLHDLTDTSSSLVLDTNGQVVNPKYLDVYRDGNGITITNQDGSVFACLSCDIVSYEHRFIIQNTSAFNDIIYNPVTGSRQNRLLLDGQKTANWNGTLDAPGFLIATNTVPAWVANQDYLYGALVTWKNANYMATEDVIGEPSFQYTQFTKISTSFSNRLLPNLSLKAQDFSHSFDTNYRPFINDLVTMRGNTIGYIERDWLSDLDIDLSSQINFYRGWIKEKGTINALNSYGRGIVNGFNTQVKINEEYAMKVGEYGASSRTGYGDVSLPATVNTKNPIVVSFVSTPDSGDTVTTQVTPFSLYEKSINWTNDFLQSQGNLAAQEQSFLGAGPVIPESLIKDAQEIPGFIDTDESSLTFANLSTMMDSQSQPSILKIAENGGSFWIESHRLASGPNQWDVIEFQPANTQIWSITQMTPDTLSFQITSDIKATINGAIVIDHVDANANVSIQRAFTVQNYFVAPNANSYANLIVTGNLTGSNVSNIIYDPAWNSPSIYLNRSLRSDSIGVANLEIGDRAYVNKDATGWAKYDLTPIYNTESTWPDVALQDSVTSISYDDVNQVLWVGKPQARAGLGQVEVRVLGQMTQSNGQIVEDLASTVYAVQPYHPDTIFLGQTITSATGIAAMSAQTTVSQIGQVYIATLNSLNEPTVTQVLSGDGVSPSISSNAGFGSSLVLSKDGQWLYVGVESMSGVNDAGLAVYAQHQQTPSTYAATIVDASTITTSTIIPNAYAIKVEVFYPNQDPMILIPSTTGNSIGDYYTVSSNTIHLVNPLVLANSPIVSVTGLPIYYKFEGSIQDPIGTGSGFGASLSCDSTGETLAIGAPDQGMGEVVVLRRVIEKRYLSNAASSILTINPFTTITQVTMNGVILPPASYAVTIGSGATITTPIPVASDLKIEGFCFELAQIISAPNAKDSGFGSSVALQSNNLAVGSPNSEIGTGAVYLYSLDSQVSSQKVIPQGDLALTTPSIRINDWAITRSGVDIVSLENDINAYTSYTGVSASISQGNLVLTFIESLQTTGIANYPFSF